MADKKKKNSEKASENEIKEETAKKAEENEASAEQNAEEGKCEELKKQLAEANDKLLRTLAEYDNFRKRSQKEKEALYSDVKAETINKLLPVADNLERAALAEADFESYKKGVQMTLNQFFEILSSLGVTPFGKKGENFDPNIHNGVMHEENEDLPENTVSDVFIRGYKMGDKIIRHATVKVAN
ncbi:MAG: nucleotide exchange factor GrpE [Oscillospiraceae bacterium]|nr:nucleotide exchange factor GrpE [Oscillospiraceae bacterium]